MARYSSTSSSNCSFSVTAFSTTFVFDSPYVRVSEDGFDLIVHIIGVGEFPDCDDVSIAGDFIHAHYLVFLPKFLSNLRECVPLDFELKDGRYVITQLQYFTKPIGVERLLAEGVS